MRLATHPTSSPYQQGLDRNAANYAPLTPLSFLERTADVFPDRLAVVHGSWQADYRTLRNRSRTACVSAGATRREARRYRDSDAAEYATHD